MKIVGICSVVGILSHQVLAGELGAIQIVAPVNHTFNLDLDELKKNLEVDEIKDQNVVVVSIAGAYRKGKSFLLNFFIRFLET